MQLTHSLKAPGFNPRTYEVKKPVSKFAFKFNLYRYDAAKATLLHEFRRGGAVQLLTPPDPQLKGAWYPGGFNPCAYQAKTWFQAFAFK
jgi:hypothetical protein